MKKSDFLCKLAFLVAKNTVDIQQTAHPVQEPIKNFKRHGNNVLVCVRIGWGGGLWLVAMDRN